MPWITTGPASSGSTVMTLTGAFSALSERVPDGRNNLLFVCNFTPVARPDYRVGVPKRGKYTLLLDQTHGALDRKEQMFYTAKKSPCDGRDYSFAYPLPAYGTAIFKF